MHRIPGVVPRAGAAIPEPASVESSIHKKVVLSFEAFDHDAECPSTWMAEVGRASFFL
jgi:hypothetical protein